MHDAAARAAPDEPQRPVTPGIFIGRAGQGRDSDLGRLVVRPQGAVAAADRAIAARQAARSARNFNSNSFTVASGGERGMRSS